MQPTIICTAPMPGMIYLNGRFAGEASADRGLYAPVSPSGAVYLEYRPLNGGGEDLAYRLVFSNGAPMAEPLSGAEGLYCVAWPSGALEAAFAPSRRSWEAFALEGLPCVLARGREALLDLNGLEVPLPEGALRPKLSRTPGAAALLGGIEGGGQYLAALSADLSACTGLLAAEHVELSGSGIATAVVSLGDSVGHGRLEQWLLDESGLNRVSSQAMWASGSPRWPDTPQGALTAAVEAMLAGMPEEAEGYLSASLAASRPLDAVGEICDACVPMQYPLPGDRPCVGLLKAESDHLATVRPLYFQAEQAGGAQGPWRITEISLE